MPAPRDDLFPTPVWTFDLPDPGPVNVALSKLIADERAADAVGMPERSAVLGWHSRDDLHRRPGFAPLVPFLRAAVGEAVALLKWDAAKATPGVAACWAVVNPPGASNVVHTHPHCALSGVYYVQAEDGCGDLFVLDPRPAALVAPPPVSAFSPWTVQRMSYPPRAGRMVLFPPWLPHGVGPNRSAADRVCVSFNVVLGPPPAG